MHTTQPLCFSMARMNLEKKIQSENTNSFTASLDFVGTMACALDRSNMLMGHNATQQCALGSTSNVILSSDLDGLQLPPSGKPLSLTTVDTITTRRIPSFPRNGGN